MRAISEQELHFGVFGMPDLIMDGRLSASHEYREILEALVGKSHPMKSEALRGIVRDEVSAKSTPLMVELSSVLNANWADLNEHRRKYGNGRGRDHHMAVRRIRRALAKAKA